MHSDSFTCHLRFQIESTRVCGRNRFVDGSSNFPLYLPANLLGTWKQFDSLEAKEREREPQLEGQLIDFLSIYRNIFVPLSFHGKDPSHFHCKRV